VLAYHNPWMPCAAIPVDGVASLPVTGLKDSSGSPDRLLDEVAYYPGEIYVGSSGWGGPAAIKRILATTCGISSVTRLC
jgi:hypothetical protein